MKLFLISQKQNRKYGSFNAAVVCAPDEITARNIDPKNGGLIAKGNWTANYFWCNSPDHIWVQYLGEADPSLGCGLVLASFIAGHG